MVKVPTIKPLPALQGYTKDFYAWCRKHELRFQRCLECMQFRHPPRPMCANCHSLQWEWAPTRGKGSIHAWTIVRKALHPGFIADVPYAVAIVELDEGPRVASWMTHLPADQLSVGMPVEVWFDDINEDVSLPKFRKIEGG